MERDVRRYACLHDLNNYFKKKDLLGGLTELELALLRKNIGIIDCTGEGGQSKPIEVTYSVFYDYIKKNSLIVGARYIITDFLTIYTSNVVNSLGKKVSWGTNDSENPSKVWRLIVTAITNNKTDSRVTIDSLESKYWIVEYNPEKEVLDDGITTKGKITYLKDLNNNSAYYDFKNIKFRRTLEELSRTLLLITQGDFYTFSDVVNGKIIDSSELHNTKHNLLKLESFNNIFIGDTYNNIIESGCTNNSFFKGCHDSELKWDSVNNIFNEPVCYTSGSIYNKIFMIGDTSLSTSITKTILKVNEATIISFLDPITYAYQIIII